MIKRKIDIGQKNYSAGSTAHFDTLKGLKYEEI